MPDQWDREVDLLVVGSGAAGVTAAITAADAGLQPLVVESTERWGGTTMRSGGGLWMPANPLMRKLGVGDLGTKGGLLTDEYARVLVGEGAPITGLYAAGNTTASVMGHTYPGPGSTIAPAVVFGYLGAHHAGRAAAPSIATGTEPAEQPETLA